MGFRFRQTFKIAPGVRLNVGKKGVSASIGRPGATVNIGRRGVRATAGLPGTGLSYSQQIGGGGGGDGEKPPTSKSGGGLKWGGVVAIIVGIMMFNGGRQGGTAEAAAIGLAGLVVVMAGSIAVLVLWRRHQRENQILALVRQQAIQLIADQCLVLLYLAKSDGRMTRQERDAIVDHVIATAPAYVDPAVLDNLVRGMDDPGTPAYRAAVERLKQAPEDIRSQILAAAEKMIGTGKNAAAVRVDVERLRGELAFVTPPPDTEEPQQPFSGPVTPAQQTVTKTWTTRRIAKWLAIIGGFLLIGAAGATNSQPGTAPGPLAMSASLVFLISLPTYLVCVIRDRWKRI